MEEERAEPSVRSTELRMGSSGQGGKGTASFSFTRVFASDVSGTGLQLTVWLSVFLAQGLFLSHWLVGMHLEKELDKRWLKAQCFCKKRVALES